MRYEIHDNEIQLFESFEQRKFLKTIGCKWDRKLKCWKINRNIDAINDLNNWFDLKIPGIEIGKSNDHISDDFKIKYLYAHQKESINKAKGLDYFADLSEPGSGKTLTQIELILRRQSFPVIIICPVSIMKTVWHDELMKWFGKDDILILNKGTDKNKLLISEFIASVKIFIISYDSVWRIKNEIINNIKPKFIILDESTKIKNPKSKRSKAIIDMGLWPEYKSIMTGTVAPNGLLDVFNQFNFLDPQLFGKSYYAFRSRYFTNTNQFLWFAKPNTYSTFKERIRFCSIQHHKRDCVDLPPLVHETRIVSMSPKQKKLYMDMRCDALIMLDGDIIKATFMTTMMVKLRQIASGFIYHNEKQTLISKSKFNEILQIISEIKGKQVIIFCSFIYTQKKITENLKREGYKAEDFGHNKELSRDEILEKFKNGDIDYLIANPASAGHGLNLQYCSNIIYAEHDFNLEYYEQSLQRIERIGQKNKMTVYHILMEGTIEKYIFSSLEKKKTINKSIDLNEIREAI